MKMLKSPKSRAKTKKQNNGAEKDTYFFEEKARLSGFSVVAGIDEAGRGPLAGPVVAAAVVVFDRNFTERIDDSKKLTERMRERAFLDILARADIGLGIVSPEEIDRLNIFNATLLAMKKAVGELKTAPDYLLIDGNMNVDLPQPRTCLIGGESLSVSIACASIIAKVTRDRLMMDEDSKYPEYGFKKHKGYGTREHMAKIRAYGLSPIHRDTFGPFGSRAK